MGAWKYLLGTTLLAGILLTPALIVMGPAGGSFDDALFVVLAGRYYKTTGDERNRSDPGNKPDAGCWRRRQH